MLLRFSSSSLFSAGYSLRYAGTKVPIVGSADELKKLLKDNESAEVVLSHPRETFEIKMKKHRADFNVQSREIRDAIELEERERERQVQLGKKKLQDDIEQYKRSKQEDVAKIFQKESGLSNISAGRIESKQKSMPESVRVRLEWRRMQRNLDRKRYRNYLREQNFQRDRRLDMLFFLYHASASFVNAENLDAAITDALQKPRWHQASDFLNLNSETVVMDRAKSLAKSLGKSMSPAVFTLNDFETSAYKSSLQTFRIKEYQDALNNTSFHGMIGPKSDELSKKATNLVNDLLK